MHVPCPFSACFLEGNVVEKPDWRDFSVLSAIATNAHLNGGTPCVIVDDTSPADDDAIQDLLQRLQPNQVTIFRSSWAMCKKSNRNAKAMQQH